MADVTHGAHGTHGARGKMNNAFDPATATGLDDETRALVERRQRLLSPAYRLFYTHPVEVVRARGVLLYDADGRDYLDAYNNVVSVGHAHPRVTEAIAAQLGTLCTHTRYLQPGILDYAEDLLGTHSGRIGRAGQAMFTCTGSEANDLALRMARHHTGRRGIIVTAEAYHGNSDLTAGISPSLGEGSPLSPWVRRVPAPDSYRRPAPGLGAWLAGQVETQIRDLERRGDGVAAFIADSLFSSDGIYAQPTDVLGPVAEVVRRAGGLFVADEVQSGFARSGERMWGYQRHGLDPDIAVMGKPMGNGLPIAGIAVRREVLADFGAAVRYFNTFGGNPVCVAAAAAVLDVLDAEQLPANAAAVGGYLTAELGRVAAASPLLGEVRGAGLYLGADVVDPATGAPSGARAAAIVNGMRDRRVLISATGPLGHTLKIRPPLPFSRANADQLLEALTDTLADLP